MSSAVDFTALKQRQMTTWASGDFAVIGTTLQVVGERVLDVAVGKVTLAAARCPP